MVQLREEFLNIDSEYYTLYLSNNRRAELPPIPDFYDTTDPKKEQGFEAIFGNLQASIDPQNIPHRDLTGISITTQAICLYVTCDEIDFPLRLELWDSPPDDLAPSTLAPWFYIAEVSFDLSLGELYIHGLMEHDIAKPIYIAPDTYRIRFYLGSLDALSEDYIHTHWSLTEDEYEEEPGDEDNLEDVDSRLQDPERNVWCRLVLWPSLYSPPQVIMTPQY